MMNDPSHARRACSAKRARGCGWLFFLLLGVGSTLASETLSKEQLSAALKTQEKALQALVDNRALAQRKAHHYKPDKHGRTLEQDFRDNLLTPDPHEHLEALLQSARQQLAAGNVAGAQSDLMSFHQTMEEQVSLFNAIVNYWRDYGRYDAMRVRFALSLRSIIDVDLSPRREANSLLDAFDRKIAAGHFVEAMNDTEPVLRTALDDAHVAEGEELRSRIQSGAFTPPLEIPVTIPCQRAKTSSKRAVPRLDSLPEYPPDHPHGGSGDSTVAVFVSAKGCAERALVIVSSGSRLIDTAALLIAQSGRYLPGEKNGAWIGGVVVFIVKLEQF
jgi:hypothetical protein